MSDETERQKRKRQIEEARTKVGETKLSDGMKEVLEEDLLTGMLGELYKKITFGNEDALRANNQFLAFDPVGQAVTADGMKFLKGLAGESALDRASAIAVAQMTMAGEKVASAVETAEAEGTAPEDHPDVIAALSEADVIRQREADTYERIEQAMQFSGLLNAVPNVPEFEDGKPRSMIMYGSSVDVIDSYRNILRFCETASYKLTDEEKAKIERLRGLFWEKYEETDLITEEKVTKWRKSRLMTEYERTMHAYEAAEMEYQTLRTDAVSGTVPGAAMRFATQGSILRNRVRQAMDEWTIAGRKTDVERVAAFLEAQGLRDAGLRKRELLDQMRAVRLTSPMGGDFHPTLLSPSSFLDEGAGWQTFTFEKRASQRSSSSERSSSETAGGGGFRIGAFAIGGRGSHASGGGSSDFSFQSQGFSLTMSYTMPTIERGAGFDRSFLQSQMIRLPDGMAPISDGGSPPKGQLTALPTRALFVRDVVMEIFLSEGESQRFHEWSKSKGKGGFSIMGIGFGGASHERSSSEGGSTWSRSRGSQTLRIDGIQMAGFLCDILPKCPVPLDDPDITWEAPDISTPSAPAEPEPA